MAATVSGGQTDSMFFSNWVGSSILEEARPHNVIKPLLNREGRRPGLVFNFPLQDLPAAATSNQTEGTAFTDVALTTSSQTATARLNGQVATVTDVLDAISIVDAVSHFAKVLGRSIAQEFETTAGAVFANSTGAWSAPSLAGFYNAMADLEAADGTGQFVAVITPATLAVMRTDLVTATTVSFAANDRNPTLDLASNFPDGSVGTIANVPCYLTSAAATSCMFIKGVSHGLYEVWDTKTETHRDIFQPGTQIAATSLYGVCTVRAAWSSDI
jgi:hypothetical protein